jgi:nucleoside-diphosphate-sugar epimerase
MKILVTGGAGFIGSFLTEALLKEGHTVRILDNLEEQVHHGKKPSYIPKEVEFIEGDVRSRETWQKALMFVSISCTKNESSADSFENG